MAILAFYNNIPLIGYRDKIFLPRKEVIHRQVPLPMPCYDFVLITGPTVGPA